MVAPTSSESAIRVLLVADPNSPTTWGWLDAIRSADVIVLGLDGRPWPEKPMSSKDQRGQRSSVKRLLQSVVSATPRRIRTAQRVRRTLGPVLAKIRGRRMRRIIASAKPDIVHALRIPYEAMEALAGCSKNTPLTVSIWGNDLTLHACNNRMVGRATRQVLARTDMLFADCKRDISLANQWGLRPDTPTAVFPGGGGVKLSRALKTRSVVKASLGEWHQPGQRLIVNARGCREYVRNDILVGALSLLAPELDPAIRILFLDAVHDKVLRRAVQEYPLINQTTIAGKYPPEQMTSLFSQSEIYVSVTAHDGTPNSLLEAMAAGAIPVCTDLPSIREWVIHKSNGFLAPLDDPAMVADALRLALNLDYSERAAIRAENVRIIAARAERTSTGREAAKKYRQLATSYEDSGEDRTGISSDCQR